MKVSRTPAVFAALLLLTITMGFVQAELTFVLELYRHGARGPLGNYYDSDQQKDIAGELTPTGIRQHFNLGAQLREEYGFFLPIRYNHSQIYVRSSDVNRTLMSAASQLQGMFPLGFGANLPSNLTLNYTLPAFENAQNYITNEQFALRQGLQVIPIHSALTAGDILLQSDSNCLNLKKLRYKFYAENNSTMTFLNKEFAETYAALSKAVNQTISTIDQVHSLESTFQCDLYNARKIPDLPAQIYTNTSYMSSLSWNYMFNQPDLLRALNTPFLESLMAYMNPVVSSGGKHPDGLKWVMYSAHDTNVQLISAALNLTSVDCLLKQRYPNLVSSSKTFYNCESFPKFTANLIFELHNSDDQIVCDNGNCIPQKTFFIRLRRDGRNMSLCDRQSTICSYEEFTMRIKAFLVNFEEVCNSLIKPSPPTSIPTPTPTPEKNPREQTSEDASAASSNSTVAQHLALAQSHEKADQEESPSSNPYLISAVAIQQIVLFAACVIIYRLKKELKIARDPEERELSIQENPSE